MRASVFLLWKVKTVVKINRYPQKIWFLEHNDSICSSWYVNYREKLFSFERERVFCIWILIYHLILTQQVNSSSKFCPIKKRKEKKEQVLWIRIYGIDMWEFIILENYWTFWKYYKCVLSHLKWIIGLTMNLISKFPLLYKRESMNLWESKSIL